MAVEIRELIIKTEVRTSNKDESHNMAVDDINVMKKQLIQEFKRMLVNTTSRQTYKR